MGNSEQVSPHMLLCNVGVYMLVKYSFAEFFRKLMLAVCFPYTQAEVMIVF